VISRHVLQPGWSWEEHAQPSVGTASCELYHRGVVLSGRMGIRTDEGEELIIGPSQVFDLPPGHVTWVEGDDVLVMVDWAGGAGFDPQPGGEARAMATILFTDIVDSTGRARDAGDESWKRTLAGAPFASLRFAAHPTPASALASGCPGHRPRTRGGEGHPARDSPRMHRNRRARCHHVRSCPFLPVVFTPSRRARLLEAVAWASAAASSHPGTRRA
jgi:hypothetical protein